MAMPVVHLSGSCSLAGQIKKSQFKETHHSPNVFSFLGIPYAKPPINELRFKPPQPFNPWVGQRQATEYGSACPQDLSIIDKYPFPVDKPPLSEDCLFLNVWTQSLDSKSKLPVMFCIHGGGFIQGFSDICSGTSLAAYQNVVFVSINYRLGALGFLCTGDSVSPGNYGMLDQIEALKWVQKNIDKFGGDPDNVTIFGCSAGGISVSLLMMSRLADGLFRRGISESGTALMPDYLWTKDHALSKIKTKLTAKGWPSESSEEIISFLKTQPAESLVGLDAMGDTFRPVIDGEFLTADCRGVYESSSLLQRDYLLGCNNNEGALFLEVFSAALNLDINTLSQPIVNQLINLSLANYFGPQVGVVMVEPVLGEYFHGVSSAEGLQKALTAFFGDLFFMVPAVDTANLHTKICRTYLYSFTHRPASSRSYTWVQADHGSEVPLVLGLVFHLPGIKSSTDDEILSQQMMAYWANFARNGDPNGAGLVEWPVYDEATRSHLVINVPLSTATHLSHKRHAFWHDTIPNIIKSASIKL